MSNYHSYSPKDGHRLAHNPFKALISPRPIGWISTLGQDGVQNLAPYSFFNAVSSAPPMVMFASSGLKDSAKNAIKSGEFVHNLVTQSQAEKMVSTSASVDESVSEFDYANVPWQACEHVKPPRVADAYACLECVVASHQEVRAADGAQTGSWLVIGEVVRVHIAEQVLRDGMVDEQALQMVSRLGYRSYGMTDRVFEIEMPKRD